MNRRKNKKGFLLAEETLKIVVALIAIVFLAYFLAQLYFAKIKGDKLEQANALLISSQENLKAIMNNLSEGETKIKQVIEPSGWYMFSYSTGDTRPNSCAGENCLCICDNAWDVNGGMFERQQKECDKNGVCLPQPDMGKFDKIKITGDLQDLHILKTGGKIYFSG